MAAVSAPKKSSALSAIDAIFASKGPKASPSEVKAVQGSAKPQAGLDGGAKARGKGKGKAKEVLSEVERRKATSPDDRKRPAVEEVIDSSSSLVSHQALPSSLDPDSRGPRGSKRKVELDEEERLFRGSRASRARTDDGLPIYSIEELNIGTGGDTPLCPFDCTCCY